MRSKLLVIAAVGAALSMAACSDQHAQEVKEGAKAAAADVKDAAHEIANDPDVKEAGTAIKESAKETGAELKEAVGEAAHDKRNSGGAGGGHLHERGPDAAGARDFEDEKIYEPAPRVARTLRAGFAHTENDTRNDTPILVNTMQSSLSNSRAPRMLSSLIAPLALVALSPPLLRPKELLLCEQPRWGTQRGAS
jgi:hypothetical protein